MFSQLIRAAQEYHWHKPYDIAHDVFHHYKVWENCIWIISQERLQVNSQLVEAAAWWHDASKGSSEQKTLLKVLKKLKVTSDISEQLISIISAHSFGHTQTTLEQQVLYDADKLEYVSIPRFYIMIQGVKTGTMTQSEFDHYKQLWNQRIAKVPSTLHFDCSKKRFTQKLKQHRAFAASQGLFSHNQMS